MKHLHLRIPRSDQCSGQRAVPPATLRRRLRVRLSRGRLDRGLADGFPPEAFEDLSLRAFQLADLATRRQVAGSLRRLVRHAELPAPARLGSAVPVCRRSVLRWREGLLGLAERLDDPAPVNPCGVARALVLLTDGASPLYNPHEARGMREAVWWVADGLQLSASHNA
jgi:hypothetical protein